MLGCWPRPDSGRAPVSYLGCELLHDGSRVRVTMVQLPAVTTPQFGWVKSRLPRRARPLPPVFQPEVAAEAILWAAAHERRELDVGLSTVIAIWSDKLAAGLGDRYLARTGFAGQQHDGPEDPARPDNLWAPGDADRDHGAHGAFDDQAHVPSAHLWATTHRTGLSLLGVGIAASAAGGVLRKRH